MTTCKRMTITPTKLVLDLEDEMNQVCTLSQGREGGPLAIGFPNKINLPVLSEKINVSMPGH